jgi:hypothetical protein
LVKSEILLTRSTIFDVSHLPKGMYTLTVTSHGEFRSKKFVLQ